MKVENIIGADISKTSIDMVCHLPYSHLKITNSLSGFQEMLDWFRKQDLDLSVTMVLMEHTGLYSYSFEAFLHQHLVAFTKVNALTIKRSIGMVRGKTDKVDARRIAGYGYEKRGALVKNLPEPKDLERLKRLNSTRSNLVKQHAAILCSIKEHRNIGIAEKDLIIKVPLTILKAYEKQIALLDQEIKQVIEYNQEYNKNFKLLQTIKGVGKVVALATIIKTANFTRFSNARKFACYCGTAPFEHSSGSSIKGRTRVSQLADKNMKTLLDLGAKSAIQHDPEIREFYQRRIGMGKSKMSTINIVRNKILSRMFAVIKRQTAFMDNYLQVA